MHPIENLAEPVMEGSRTDPAGDAGEPRRCVGPSVCLRQGGGGFPAGGAREAVGKSGWLDTRCIVGATNPADV